MAKWHVEWKKYNTLLIRRWNLIKCIKEFLFLLYKYTLNDMIIHHWYFYLSYSHENYVLQKIAFKILKSHFYIYNF